MGVRKSEIWPRFLTQSHQHLQMDQQCLKSETKLRSIDDRTLLRQNLIHLRLSVPPFLKNVATVSRPGKLDGKNVLNDQ